MDARDNIDQMSQPLRAATSKPGTGTLLNDGTFSRFSQVKGYHEEAVGYPMQEAGTTNLLKEVLRQLDEDKSHREQDMEKLKAEVYSQQAILKELAQTLLGGTLEEALAKIREDVSSHKEQLDLQARALREGLLDMAGLKVAGPRQEEQTRRLLGELREELSMQTQGVKAACETVAQEFAARAAEDCAASKQHAEALCDQLRQQVERSQEVEVKKLEQLVQAAQRQVDVLDARLQQQPNPAEALQAQQLAAQHAALADSLAGEVRTAVLRAQESAASAASHATSAESQAAVAQSAVEAVATAVAAAENHARDAQKSAEAGSRSVETAETHASAARNALLAVQTNAELVREKSAGVEQHSASVQGMAEAMAEQASALQATSSAVGAASERATAALSSEAERQLAMMSTSFTSAEEKLQLQLQQAVAKLDEVSERCATQSAADATESSKLKEELEVQLQDRLGQTRSDLAECAQLTQVVSERLEAVEAQLRAELAKLMVLGQQTAVRMEEVCTAVQEATAGSGALSGSDSTKVHLEEMINTALERTEHLEQSFIAASSGPAAGLAEQVSKCRQDLQAQIEDLRNRSTSCETRLLQELERVSEVMRLAPGRDEAELKPLEPSKVRSVPAALRGMVLSCLPLPAHAGRRKALVIGCSYFESNTPLKGAINDAWNVLSLLRHTLQISESQVRFIVDGTRSCPMPPQRRPTAATIAEGLQWLAADTLPGDEVFLYFAGYGALLPHGVGSFEACLVPIDYAALKSGGGDSTGGYRLVPLTEVSQALSKLPAGCKATVVLDCCHSSLPGVGSKPQPAMFQWAQMQPAAFAGMDQMADARARRMVLPSIPLQAPQAIEVPAIECSLTCYSACYQAQWCGELPIEGVVQGAFTWAWVKAMVAGNCEGSVSQVKASLQASIGDLQRRCRWLDQTPLVQMSKAMEQQEVSKGEVSTMWPDIMRNPLSPNARRKALIIGVNYAGSHAPLKGAVNDAWNLHAVLRQSLLFEEDQVRLLVDDGEPAKLSQVPSKDNILSGFQWLMDGAQPGDSLVLAFSGYGTQHPKDADGKDCEAYLVPSDYAEDLPEEWWSKAKKPSAVQNNGRQPNGNPAPGPPAGASYRLISMLELNRFITQVPAGATLTTILDCSYPIIPGVSPSCNLSPTFPRVTRGRVDYERLFDFVSRPRFLELPPLPVQHTLPQVWRPQTFPSCRLHVFSASRLQEWPSELPLEGTVQGTFTWSFAKALAAGKLQCTVGQQQQAMEAITVGLKEHFQGVEQTPVLMLSQAASSNDTVFA